MPINYALDTDGNAIKTPRTKKAGGKTEKVTKSNDWQIAERAMCSFSRPIAYMAGVMWGYHPNTGWTDVTRSFLTHCHKLRGRNAKSNVYEIVCDQMAIPTEPAVLYWERRGEAWSGEWVPFHVKPNQVVYSDALVNITTGEPQPLEGQIIYGPMITLPWHTDTGDAPICQEFEDLVARGIPDPEIRRHFQEMCGLVLQPHVHLRGQIVLWGPRHTGKSTLAAAIACAAAGMHGAAFITEERLIKDKWASIALVNKFACVSNDSEATPRWETWLMNYSSGDLIVEPKFHKPANAPVTAKLFSTCNQMQAFSNPSGAGSMRLYPFRVGNPIPITGDPGQPNLGLPRYWCSAKRRAGVVQWLLVGLERMHARGLFSEPLEYQEIRDQALAEANPLEAWVRECITEDKTGWVRLADVVQAMPNDIHEGTPRGLETKLGILFQRLFGIKATRRTVAGVQQRGYAGITLRE